MSTRSHRVVQIHDTVFVTTYSRRKRVTHEHTSEKSYARTHRRLEQLFVRSRSARRKMTQRVFVRCSTLYRPRLRIFFSFDSQNLYPVCTVRDTFRDLPSRDYDVAVPPVDVARFYSRSQSSLYRLLLRSAIRAPPTQVATVTCHHVSPRRVSSFSQFSLSSFA